MKLNTIVLIGLSCTRLILCVLICFVFLHIPFIVIPIAAWLTTTKIIDFVVYPFFQSIVLKSVK